MCIFTFLGGLVLTGKAAVLKTAGFIPWGFESLALRHSFPGFIVIAASIRAKEIPQIITFRSLNGRFGYPDFSRS